MVETYRGVLSTPGAARLFATGLVARLPQGMSSLAILLLVRQRTASYAAAGIAVGAYALANAVCSPLQGRLVDRYGRRHVLAPSALLQAGWLTGLVLAALGGAGAASLVVLAALAGGFFPPIAPAVRALLPDILPDAELRESAYALESVIQELIWIAGPLVVAVVITMVSPAAAVLVSGAVCVAGTLLFVASPGARGARARGRATPRTPVLGLPGLRALLGPVGLMGVSLGAVEVGLPALALHAGSRPSSGLLLALWSVGSLVGGLWHGSRGWRLTLHARYRALLLAGVACTAPLIVAATIPEGLACSLLAGLTIAPVFACQYALVEQSVPAGVETEAFAWVAAALVSGVAAGEALAGILISSAGERSAFVVACGALALAALSAARAPVAAEQPA